MWLWRKKTFPIHPQFITSAMQRNMAGIFLVSSANILQAGTCTLTHPYTHTQRDTDKHTLSEAVWVVCCSLGDSAICCLASQGGQSLPMYCCPDSKGSPLQYNTTKASKNSNYFCAFYVILLFSLLCSTCLDLTLPLQHMHSWDIEWMFMFKTKNTNSGINNPDFIQNVDFH